MTKRQYLILILGCIALFTLFLMLPESPGVGCTTCSSSDPYISLIGSAYFSFLIALALLFPSFPNRVLAKCGLVWAILLGLAMTYMRLPVWCPLCLIGHLCNILIWAIGMKRRPFEIRASMASISERVCVACIVPLSVVACFGALNLTFMVYGFAFSGPVLSAGLRPGDEAPPFSMQTLSGRTITNQTVLSEGGMVINFVSSECPFCKEQMQMMNEVLDQMGSRALRVVNVSSVILPGWNKYQNLRDWVEDKGGDLRRLFTVTGYPTLIKIGVNGKITRIISGVPDELKSSLVEILAQHTYQNALQKEAKEAQLNFPSGDELMPQVDPAEISLSRSYIGPDSIE